MAESNTYKSYNCYFGKDKKSIFNYKYDEFCGKLHLIVLPWIGEPSSDLTLFRCRNISQYGTSPQKLVSTDFQSMRTLDRERFLCPDYLKPKQATFQTMLKSLWFSTQQILAFIGKSCKSRFKLENRVCHISGHFENLFCRGR